ncbi:gephyrin [Prorops nasuta]|uniref:gephyrin n=1 Tax=Prorops nasuta TaxID=863751 RepID=UPI0034CF8AA4
MTMIRYGILIVSDSCSSGDRKDLSGPEIKNIITNKSTDIGKLLNGTITCEEIVEDNEYKIMDFLATWCDQNKVDVILTSGGTGFSERDVTPEATKKIIQKEAPCIIFSMFLNSIKWTPMAMLSRAISGIRGKTLIINLPGSHKAVKECLTAVAPAISHAVDLLLNDKSSVIKTHNAVQNFSFKFCHTPASTEMLGLHNVSERSRSSPYPMISVEEAKSIIFKEAYVMNVETINISNALGRVIKNNVYSQCDLPPFRASIKDGYAVIASDRAGKRKVLGGVKAGSTTTILPKLLPGTCIRVNTGAPVPDGANAVVQVEDTKLIETLNSEEVVVDILISPKAEQDIRPIGSDIEKNSLVLSENIKIGAAEIGILAACGCKEIDVYKQPVIGILSTGDELQEVGEPLLPGHVYDSNKLTLMSILEENNFKPLDMGIAQDDEMTIVQTITNALKAVDVLITTGSVSMGDKDMLKPILKHYFGATLHFGRVNMKPGKPTTFATCMLNNKKKYLLCLPGNPVSATVTTHLFVLPLLNKMQGLSSKPIIVQAELTSDYQLDPRPEYARVTLKWSDKIAKAYSTGNQISSKLLSCQNANAFIILPGSTNQKTSLKAGEYVPAMLLGFNQ